MRGVILMYINKMIESNSVVLLRTKCDEEYVFYLNIINDDILLGIEINDMKVDGIGVYRVSKLMDIIKSFDSKPVYNFMIKNTNLENESKAISQLAGFDFLDILEYLSNNNIFVGIESVFNDEHVMDIGYIREISAEGLSLHCVNTDGNFDSSTYFIDIEDIVKIEIGSYYLNVYEDFLNCVNK